jgi:Uncharacterised protein family (UPF0175)
MLSLLSRALKGDAVTIGFEIPEDIGGFLALNGEDLSRLALESLALESYRTGKLTQSQIRRLLGYQTRMEIDGFLKEHGVPLEYSLEDFDREGDVTRSLRDQCDNDRQQRRAG